MIITTWLWHQPGFRYEYTEEHVHNLKRMLDEHLSIPRQLVCFSDREIEGVQTYPIRQLGLESKRWPKEKYPQCFNRLWLFSEEAREIVGDRFLNIDLDCVIRDNIDSILTRKEDFIIAKGNAKRNGYSGSMWMMNTGAREDVWKYLHPELLEKAMDKFVGSDQAWIRYCLGPNEAMFTEDDGVYYYHYLKKKQPPEDAKIVFFAGTTKAEDVDWT